MPLDELPMYPTPQQASYVVGSPPSHSGQRKPSQPKANVAYRPPKQYQVGPTQPQQGYAVQPMGNHHHIQQQQQPPQQYYQPQPTPQPPVQHYNSVPPPPQQPQYAPTPQQYYQGHPLPQGSHFLQQQVPPPQQQQRYDYQAPPPNQQQHLHQPPPQLLRQSPPPQQQYSSSSHKKPPPMGLSPPPKARSKESLVRDQGAPTKASLKQKLEQELRSVFDKVDLNGSGKISAKELSLALLNFDNTRFQESTVLLMIRLFSSSSDVSAVPLKSLNFDQFVSLWKYLSAYKKLFVQADTNKSGDISFGEFQKILEQIGYKLNIDLVLNLFQKFSYKDSFSGYDAGASVGKLKFDAFIELLVYLRKLTDVFKKYDKDLSGVATISFADFLFEISNLT